MRYDPERAATFPTKDWQKLWESSITTLPQLAEAARTSGFVAIDVEPDADLKPAEIGLSFLPPQPHHHPEPKVWLKDLQQQFSIQSHCFRPPNKDTRLRKSFHLGEVEYVTPQDMEQTFAKYLHSFASTISESDPESHPKLVLVGFDLGFEMRWLSKEFLTILQKFTSWIDMQELINNLATGPVSRCRPNMRECLMAFGFSNNNARRRSQNTRHNAGMDTMRIIGLLLKLLTFETDRRIDITRYGATKTGERRQMSRHFGDRTMNGHVDMFVHRRPSPPQRFPFLVEVRLLGTAARGIRPITLNEIFCSYKLIAVASAKTQRPGATYVKGWIALEDLQSLEEVVRHVKDGMMNNEQMIWIAISWYNHEVTPVRTAKEAAVMWTSFQKVANEKKVVERQSKKEKMASDNILGYQAGFFADNASEQNDVYPVLKDLNR